MCRAWDALKGPAISDNTSVIDAIKVIAKATKEDTGKVSDMVKGVLHADQIDDLRIMLSRARDGTVVRGAATTAAATSAASASSASAAAAPRDTSVQRRAWKGGANKASAKFQGVPPSTSEGHFRPLLSATAPTWRQVATRAQTPHPTLLLRMQRLPPCRPKTGRYMRPRSR